MKRDLVIYIHGVSPDVNLVTTTEEYISAGVEPKHRASAEFGHAGQYEAFHQGVARFISDPDDLADWQNAVLCKTEWGWESAETDARLGKSHRLIDAEYHLGLRVMAAIRGQGLWSKLLAPMRRISLYGLADVFYYVTPDGKASIRRRIADQIAMALGDCLEDPHAEVSCTLIGHSAGSVIALDVVTDLLGGKGFIAGMEGLEQQEATLETQAQRIGGSGGPEPFTKGEAVISDSLGAVQRLRKLLTLVESGRLKLHKLITLGSPNTMLALRSDEAVNALAYAMPMDPRLLGFTDATDASQGSQERARWLNVWDSRDPISFPVAPLLQEGPLVKDVRVATTFKFWKSHTEYWNSRAVHRAVAANL